MAILVEASPVPKTFFEKTSTGSVTPADNYVQAYGCRVRQFQRELANVFQIVTEQEEPVAASRYPVVEVSFSLELAPQSCAIDEDLYTTMFDKYVLYGWPGIAAIENAINAMVRGDNSGRPGGTAVSVWFPALSFFLFTKKLIASLVRDTIAQLETQVASQMVAHLSVSSIAVTKVWSRYGFEREVKRKMIRTREYSYAVDTPQYRAANGNASDALFQVMINSVQARVAFEELEQKLAAVRDQIQDSRAAALKEHQKKEPFDPTDPSSYDPNVQIARDLDEQATQKALARLVSRERILSALADGAQTFRDTLQEQLTKADPLALLIVEKLRPTFDQNEMEQVFGETLWQLFDNLDQLGSTISPERSNTNAIVRGLPKSTNITTLDLDHWVCPKAGPEGTIITAAITGVAEDPGLLPLLARPTWEFLQATGRIATDTVAYVVAYHFQGALERALEAQGSNDRESAKLWRILGKVSAALSLASLAAPVTEEMVPVFRGVSAIADLMILGHTVHSVMGQLARFDELLREEFIDPNAFAFEHLGRIRAHGAYRDRFVEGLKDQFLMELLLIAAGEQWLTVSRLLTFRTYLADVDALLSDETD